MFRRHNNLFSCGFPLKLSILVIFCLTLSLTIKAAPSGSSTGLEFPSFVPDHSFIGRALTENKYFIHFINVSTSNFGDAKQTEQFQKAVEHHFLAHRLSLKNDYLGAFYEIRKSHLVLHQLFQNLLENNYHKDTKLILDAAAPTVIYANDKRAQLLLRLGYREYEVSRRKMIFGENQSRFLFSQKIHFYLKAVKTARTAKRLAFLALMEARTPYAEKDEYRLQTIDEALRKQKNEVEDETVKLDYLRVKHMLTNFIERKQIENLYDYLHHHNDNFGFISQKNILENFDLDFLKKP